MKATNGELIQIRLKQEREKLANLWIAVNKHRILNNELTMIKEAFVSGLRATENNIEDLITENELLKKDYENLSKGYDDWHNLYSKTKEENINLQSRIAELEKANELTKLK